MSAEILVALKREDRLSEMIFLIEKIAEPGMKVVLLIGFHPSAPLKPLRSDLLELRSLEDPGFDGNVEKPQFAAELVSSAPLMERQWLTTEHKVYLTLEALRRKGVEILVDVYAGSLKGVLKHYSRKGNVHLIVKRLGKLRAMMQSVRRAFPVFGAFKERPFSSVLLTHSNHAVSG